MHHASHTPRQSQLPFQAVLETWEKEKEKKSCSASLVVFQVLETDYRLMEWGFNISPSLIKVMSLPAKPSQTTFSGTENLTVIMCSGSNNFSLFIK